MGLGGLQFEPVCYDDTEDVEGELNGDELSTAGVLGGLSCPDGDDGVQDTGSDTVNQTSCYEN